jgi:fatty-acid desaturase
MFASSTSKVQLFFIISLILSALGIYLYGFNFETFLLVLAGYFLYGCLGITVTFHRLLAHRSYKTYPIIEKIMSVLGTLGGTGSALSWVSVHVNHHLKSDKEGDPHSPIHKGIKIFKLDYEQGVDPDTKWRIRDLISNKFQQFLHKYYSLIFVSWSLVCYAIGGLYLMIFLHLMPVVITVVISNISNYVGHMPNLFGSSRRYNTPDHSTNNWILAIPTWGEAWHNNHHRYPKRSSFGEKWWEFDLSAIIINLIKIK